MTMKTCGRGKQIKGVSPVWSGSLVTRLAIAALVVMTPFVGAQAQLTELGGTTASGATTTAQFSGGVTADNGATHKSVIAFDEEVDVVTQIRVEESHINTVGNLYVVVVSGPIFFMGVENQGFVVWDQNPANLQPMRSAVTLSAAVDLPIVENIVFGPAGVSDTTLQIFVAYDTTAAAGELYYSPAPLTFTVEAEQTQTQAQSLTTYQQSISGPIIQGICRTCHVQGGQASLTSNLLYVAATESGILTNYNTLVDYIKSGNSAKLLAKPTGGTAHDGGVWFTQGSSNFTNWSTFINQVLGEN